MDDIRDRRLALIVHHIERDQVRGRRNASVPQYALARCRHEGAVTVPIAGRVGSQAGEVDLGENAGGAEIAGPTRSMPESTIAIVGIDRFASPTSRTARRSPTATAAGFEYDGALYPARGHTIVGDDLGHIRALRQRQDLLAGQACLQTVDRVELLLNLVSRPTECTSPASCLYRPFELPCLSPSTITSKLSAGFCWAAASSVAST